MRLVITDPVTCRLYDLSDGQVAVLRPLLTYTDKKISYQRQKFKHATWYVNKFGYDAWAEEYARLGREEKQCLLFTDKDGYWTYSGLVPTILRHFPHLSNQIHAMFSYPEYGLLGWAKKPPFERYPYQVAAQKALEARSHAGVEIGTGLGKSYIILHLVKAMGLRTVVMAPSKDIAKRLFEDLTEAFGPKYVGFYGDGKKKVKRITVAIGASLVRVKEGSEDWKALGQAQVFIADESHQCPAATLAKVCFGLMRNAPYRFFFSATQMRNDGLDLLLDAITGPIVYKMTVREGIDQGYLARLSFTVVKSGSNSEFEHHDVNEMTRAHFLYNDRVLRQAASLANNFANTGKRVLILIDEFEQFTKLYPLLKHSVRFAHGGVSKENKDKLPEPFHDSDPSLFVKQFNNEEFSILVGTACITTGTDVKANEVTINLQGGKSEIAVMQGPCGRSTRLFQFKDGRKKDACHVIDFDIENIDILNRHCAVRKAIYLDAGPVRELAYG